MANPASVRKQRLRKTKLELVEELEAVEGLLAQMEAADAGEGHGTWIAMAVASLVFGLAHSISWTYIVLATLIGFYFGWLFWISGNLLVPIATHAFYDFYALVYFVKAAGR